LYNTSNASDKAAYAEINALDLLYKYVSIVCRSSLSSPPHLVRPVSRPYSGKNFSAVCSGVVDDLLDELLLPSCDTRLPCARMSPAGGRVGEGVPVVIVSADFSVGKILVRVVAVIVGS
jgi:hypothetical protein